MEQAMRWIVYGVEAFAYIPVAGIAYTVWYTSEAVVTFVAIVAVTGLCEYC